MVATQVTRGSVLQDETGVMAGARLIRTFYTKNLRLFLKSNGGALREFKQCGDGRKGYSRIGCFPKRLV